MNNTTIKNYLCLLLLLSSTPCFADFVSGMEAYKAGDFTTAHKTWKKFAERDMSHSNWRQAAEQADAQFALALLYFYWEGKGVTQDIAEAKKWLELAAGQGDAGFKLGELYLTGLAGTPYFPEGIKWMEMAETLMRNII